MIKLEITANNVEELNTQLQGLVKAVEQQGDTPEERPPYAKSKTIEKPKSETKVKAVDKKTDPKPAEEEKEVSVSVEDLRAKTLELKKLKGSPAVRAILKDFDTEKITELSEDSYEDFYAALEEALSE